jgi:hypothetical protein
MMRRPRACFSPARAQPPYPSVQETGRRTPEARIRSAVRTSHQDDSRRGGETSKGMNLSAIGQAPRSAPGLCSLEVKSNHREIMSKQIKIEKVETILVDLPTIRPHELSMSTGFVIAGRKGAGHVHLLAALTNLPTTATPVWRRSCSEARRRPSWRLVPATRRTGSSTPAVHRIFAERDRGREHRERVRALLAPLLPSVVILEAGGARLKMAAAGAAWLRGCEVEGHARLLFGRVC